MKNYVKDTNTFLFRRSWGEVFKDMSDEEVGKIVKAVYAYADGVDDLTEQLTKYPSKCIYKMMIRQLNNSSAKYLKRVEQFRKETETAAINPDSSQEE